MDAKTVKNTAWLARIEIPPERLGGLTRDLEQILAYVAVLDDLDLDGIEPFARPVTEGLETRADVPRGSLSSAEALANAPCREGDFFSVPRILPES